MSEKGLRVKDFTYYPLMSDVMCAFKVETHKGAETFHQCEKYGKTEIGGYRFCQRHAEIIKGQVNEQRQSHRYC